jgi:hypothetical protein
VGQFVIVHNRPLLETGSVGTHFHSLLIAAGPRRLHPIEKNFTRFLPNQAYYSLFQHMKFGSWEIVTLLSGITSLTLAFIALAQATRTAKLNAQANVQLEKVRAENAREFEKLKTQLLKELEEAKDEKELRLKAYETACEQVLELENGIAQSWQVLQDAKDVLRKIQAAETDTELYFARLSRLNALDEELNWLYRELGPKFKKHTSELLHKIRPTLSQAISYLELHKKEKDVEVPFSYLVGKFTECQRDLLAMKEVLRHARMEELLSLWKKPSNS